MIRLDNSHTDVASVSNPGVIRNFRVQIRDREVGDWHMYSTYRTRNDAELCISALHLGGVDARLIDCDRCPTAL